VASAFYSRTRHRAGWLIPAPSLDETTANSPRGGPARDSPTQPKCLYSRCFASTSTCGLVLVAGAVGGWPFMCWMIFLLPTYVSSGPTLHLNYPPASFGRPLGRQLPFGHWLRGFGLALGVRFGGPRLKFIRFDISPAPRRARLCAAAPFPVVSKPIRRWPTLLVVHPRCASRGQALGVATPPRLTVVRFSPSRPGVRSTAPPCLYGAACHPIRRLRAL